MRKAMRDIARGAWSVTLILVLTFSLIPQRSIALTECDMEDILSNSANFDSCATDDSCTQFTGAINGGDSEATISDVPVAVGASNTDYAGRPVLTEGQLAKIQENAPFYQQAADAYDLPWQILAVIHLREHGLARSNPSNGQGVYQFLSKEGGPYPTGPVSDTEFLRQTYILAQRIRTRYLPSNYPTNRTLTKSSPSPDAVKDLFFSYNGRAGKYAAQAGAIGFNSSTQGYEGSPYVMNKADAKRDPDVNKSTWGQVKRDFGPIEYPANKDYGAFVTYAALSGIKVSSTNTVLCTQVDPNSSGPALPANAEIRQKIVILAQQELALWQSGTLRPGKQTGYGKYSMNRSENWCADFASWIYKQAGAPLAGGSGNVAAVQRIKEIGIATGRWHPKAGYTPKPGDIVVRQNGESHVNIVISQNNSGMTIIGGNQGGGGGGFNASKVSQYNDRLGNSGITGYVSPE